MSGLLAAHSDIGRSAAAAIAAAYAAVRAALPSAQTPAAEPTPSASTVAATPAQPVSSQPTEATPPTDPAVARVAGAAADQPSPPPLAPSPMARPADSSHRQPAHSPAPVPAPAAPAVAAAPTPAPAPVSVSSTLSAPQPSSQPSPIRPSLSEATEAALRSAAATAATARALSVAETPIAETRQYSSARTPPHTATHEFGTQSGMQHTLQSMDQPPLMSTAALGISPLRFAAGAQTDLSGISTGSSGAGSTGRHLALVDTEAVRCVCVAFDVCAGSALDLHLTLCVCRWPTSLQPLRRI